MIYHLSIALRECCSAFNAFHYISFRAGGALLTALGLALIFGNKFIQFSITRFSSPTREYVPKTHLAKGNVPITGGLFIGAIVLVTILIWGNLCKPKLWLMLLCLTLFGAIGFVDDWSKIKERAGIKASTKILLQLLAAIIVVGIWIWWQHPKTVVLFPFFKNFHPDIGIFFTLWAIFLIIATSNAVNLTDGLDGLATNSLIVNFIAFSLICYITGHAALAKYLNLPFTHSGELTVVGGAITGALFGFLWFNTYPAQIFLGDAGSLALGAGLAFMALMCKQELLLVISGGLFVIETLSVIIQVVSFKLRGKRVFKMAPLHHHFELLGWPEAKVTVRMGIISIILCLLVLMTIKIR